MPAAVVCRAHCHEIERGYIREQHIWMIFARGEKDRAEKSANDGKNRDGNGVVEYGQGDRKGGNTDGEAERRTGTSEMIDFKCEEDAHIERCEPDPGEGLEEWLPTAASE